jgi:hypothetical protein
MVVEVTEHSLKSYFRMNNTHDTCIYIYLYNVYALHQSNASLQSLLFVHCRLQLPVYVKLLFSDFFLFFFTSKYIVCRLSGPLIVK